jgi:hypothetical protein
MAVSARTKRGKGPNNIQGPSGDARLAIRTMSSNSSAFENKRRYNVFLLSNL